MSIAFVGAATDVSATVNRTGGLPSITANVTVTSPSATAVGDTLLAMVYTSSEPTVTAPSGWTRVAGPTTTSGNDGAVYTKVATATGATAETWQVACTGNVISGYDFGVAAYRGANYGIDGTPGITAGFAVNPAAPSVTPAGPSDFLVCAYSGGSGGTTPSGMTADSASTVTGWFSQQLVSTSATGTKTYTGRNGNAAASILLAAYTAPNAPALTLPANSSSINRTVTQRFSWSFSPTVPGDTQSSFSLRYSSDSGATWTTVSGTTPNQYVDIASGTFSAASYQWQVRTTESQGLTGPWSSSSFFTAASPPAGPTITAPTSGASLPSNTQTVTFSYPTLTAYRYQVVDGVGATIVPLTTVTNPSSRSFTISGLANGSTVTISLAVQSAGLWSSDVTSTNAVAYTPPATPSVTLAPTVTTANPGSTPDALLASWTVATGAIYVDVYLSTDGGVTSERKATMLTPSGTYLYRTPASGTDYSVQVVAYASNGTSSASAWVTGGGGGGAHLYPGATTYPGASTYPG